MGRCGGYLLLGLFLFLFTVPALADDYTEHWLQIALDHQQDIHFARVLLNQEGEIFVRHLDLMTLELPAPEVFGFHHDGERFHVARALPTHRVHVDLYGGYVHFIRRDGQRPFSRDGVLLLDIMLPHESPMGPVRVLERDGELFLPVSVMKALRIDVADLPEIDGHVPVHALAGDNYVVNTRALGLWVTVSPEQRQLNRLRLRGHSATEPTQPGRLSANINYDISGGVDEGAQEWRAALLGGAVAHGYGRCESRSLLARDESRWRRLDSQCSYDWPDALLFLRVGDGISRQDNLGQPVRYAGVRIGTDFSLAPAMQLQPDLLLPGTSRLPSTLELWVNQNLAGQQSVGTGPFVIEDAPTLTGAGEVRLVIEDALGGREIISLPYYSAPGLLRRGLSDWSIEAGRLRENFALAEDQYTEHLALLAGRRGMTDWLTLNARAEYQEDAFHGLGTGGVLRLWRLGQLELAAMNSRDTDAVDGKMWQGGFSRRGRRASFAVRHMRSDRRFRQLGYAEVAAAPAIQTQANVGLRMGRNLSVTVAAFQREDHDGAELRLYSAGLNMPVLQRGQLRLSATFPDKPAGDDFYGLNFTLPLGQRTSGSAGSALSGNDVSHSLNIQRNLPAGRGFGYRAGVADTNGSRVSEAELHGQTDIARLGLRARDTESGSSGSARLGGSLLVTRSGLGASREPGTAATVMLPTAGVRIYHDNQPVATTNARGRAVIAGLRPYEANRLRLESDDLPIHATLAETELTIVPARGQVVAADFDVRLQRHINARLVTAAGDRVPAGASVWLDGERQATGIGHQGVLYLRTVRSDQLALDVVWRDRRCKVSLPAVDTGVVIQDLGEQVCW